LVLTVKFHVKDAELPAVSATKTVTVYYTAINAATDYAIVELLYSTQPWPDGDVQTFIQAGVGTAITQTTKATSHVTLTIPAGKGGALIGFITQVYGVVTTVSVGGGFMQVHNSSVDPTLEPLEHGLGGLTSIGTGGGELPLNRWHVEGDCPGNSIFTFDYTPENAESQYLAIMVVWEA
jgi:hypothetical protein